MDVNAQPRLCSISVILPTYNETQRLPQTVKELVHYLSQNFKDYEILIVDDLSPDGTGQLIAKMSAINPKIKLFSQPGRLGKGAAVRRGALAATKEYILYMDADHATPIQEVEKMLKFLNINDRAFVAGVRTYQEDESRWRRILGLLLQILAHLIVFKKAVIDSQCGFKLFTQSSARELFGRSFINGGMIDVEIFFLAHELKIPAYYQPVHWHNGEDSKIRIIRCMLLDPLDLFRIRFKGFLGFNQKLREC